MKPLAPVVDVPRPRTQNRRRQQLRRPRDRHVFGVGAVAVIAILPVLVALGSTSGIPPLTHGLVALLWVLSVAPAFFYLRKSPDQRRPIPFLPVVSLLYGLYYALPLTLGITDQYYNAPVDASSDYSLAVDLALLGWVVMTGSYTVFGVILRIEAPRRSAIRDTRVVARWGLILLYGGLIGATIRFYVGATELAATFQFVVSLQWLGAGLLTILARRGQLSATYRVLTVVGIVATSILVIAAGSMAPLMMLFTTVALSLWIGRPKIEVRWALLLVTVLLTAMTIRGVASEFRRIAWFGTGRLTQVERVGLTYELLRSSVRDRGLTATIIGGVTQTAGRSATMDLLAHVARRTPSEVPHWNGRTYLSLVGAFIPRALWPDKPTKGLGQEFGHRYGLIHFTNLSTSINLPFLVEFYLNFSTVGVIVGMVLVGLIYRVLDGFVNRPGQDAITSMVGVVLVLPLLLLESDFSLVFGGLPLTSLALYIVWRSVLFTDSASKQRQISPSRYGYASLAVGQLTSGGQQPPNGTPRARLLR